MEGHHRHFLSRCWCLFGALVGAFVVNRQRPVFAEPAACSQWTTTCVGPLPPMGQWAFVCCGARCWDWGLGTTALVPDADDVLRGVFSGNGPGRGNDGQHVLGRDMLKVGLNVVLHVVCSRCTTLCSGGQSGVQCGVQCGVRILRCANWCTRCAGVPPAAQSGVTP